MWGATSGAGTTILLELLRKSPFLRGSCYSIFFFSFCVVFCRALFVLLSFFSSVHRAVCRSSIFFWLPVGIFKLVLLTHVLNRLWYLVCWWILYLVQLYLMVNYIFQNIQHFALYSNLAIIDNFRFIDVW